MKKKKIQKTNVDRILDQAKIEYELFELPWSEAHLDAGTVAQTLGLDSAIIYKTLVTVGDKTGPVIAVLPGNQELNLKKLAKASGNKKIEMLHMKDLEVTTGYIRGGCSPIGMKKLFPTYIAKQAETADRMLISAGKRGKQVGLKPQDLAPLVKAKFVDIIQS